MCDNHSINTTNHNVINNNFTQAEREKTPEELKHERELAFREKCLDVYKDGIMTSDEKRELEDLRYELGLDERSAHRIMSEVAKQRSERKSSSLSPVHQKTFNNIKTAIISNRLDLVNRPLAQMKAMVQRYSVEEIQFTYYMLQAVLQPEDCVEEYEKQFEDNYWQSFWSSIAYRRVGNIEKSEILVADVFDKWTDTFPQENVSILATVNALIDNESVAAKSHYDNISGEHSLFLSTLTTCLYAILYNDVVSPKELKLRQQDFAFYSNNLFADIIARNKKEAEAKAKRLAEEKRKKEEQERKAHAEVRAFYEAELKRKEEEEREIARKQQQERKRLAEEKRKKEEQERKAQAEIRAYYEAELKRKEEEERKIAQKQKQERERLAAEEKRKQKVSIDNVWLNYGDDGYIWVNHILSCILVKSKQEVELITTLYTSIDGKDIFSYCWKVIPTWNNGKSDTISLRIDVNYLNILEPINVWHNLVLGIRLCINNQDMGSEEWFTFKINRNVLNMVNDYNIKAQKWGYGLIGLHLSNSYGVVYGGFVPLKDVGFKMGLKQGYHEEDMKQLYNSITNLTDKN